ncbi:MAG: YcfA-like protein [Candidatus Methanoperedens nitroreducens]|uniref:YcfA-like protein n=1 Tax=Candidatus Methanoperedens nitratireducens TaxID=1392998 RepID=A0A0P8A8C2_9EURY|nr:type II toxin-antitoxin system HicA family toxin [Candidatus Methanoperedens sp. BLZ2]KAB2941645.1 MAG: type II toxin-antitoxin system HicA family toxin [Candidatus Methanoperedens sp.]KPQ44439.1 MAG: YcfA-like protein [Candidatus Methanoperedens sp. BLZ1]MBZ0177037.1 type II toxin-antitoxin system HicA family toxin [Candidatus Methanoperedens nitroreducens]MCX9079344.1 type II toxin-antitoxin system HicA family toxin [Candidatus Methanoperedens sp.]
MTRLLPVSGKEMCKILEKLGFKKIHQVGSHVRYVHFDGRRTVVSVHGNEELSIGLIKEIMRQVELSREDYEKLRNEI